MTYTVSSGTLNSTTPYHTIATNITSKIMIHAQTEPYKCADHLYLKDCAALLRPLKNAEMLNL